MGFLKDKLDALLGKKKPVELTEEEKRHASDAEKLATYQAFDTEMGANPTQETLQKRFQDAVMAGHTSVIKDTITKGLDFPNDFTTTWWPPFGGPPLTMHHKPLQIAARRKWADAVEAMVEHCNTDNLHQALRAAEADNNIVIGKTIHTEMARRGGQPEETASAAPDTAALTQPIAVRKSTLQLK